MTLKSIERIDIHNSEGINSRPSLEEIVVITFQNDFSQQLEPLFVLENVEVTCLINSLGL